MSDELKIPAGQVKALREATGAGMMDSKRALQESGGDMERAAEWLRLKGLDRAKGKAGRIASEGLIDSYIHFNGRVGVLVEVNCETDFVANTDEFRQLAKDIALHIASAPTTRWVDRTEVPDELVDEERRVYEGQAREQGKSDDAIQKMVPGKLEAFYRETVLLDQPYAREPEKTIGELVAETSAKLGEKVAVRRFARFQLGEDVG
jgi:elongation factor Ts